MLSIIFLIHRHVTLVSIKKKQKQKTKNISFHSIKQQQEKSIVVPHSTLL